MPNENDDFVTRDLYLATTLMTLRYSMVGIDYQVEGSRVRPVGYFHFENTPALRESEQQYWQGKLNVEPRTFITNMRSLKAQVNCEYKSPHSDVSTYKPRPV